MKQTILIIEDNERNIYLMTYILEQHSYQVIQARNGPEGIRLALECIPQLILLDIQLPGMDGYAVLAQLRQHSTLAQIAVVAVTSYAMPGDRERALEAGCNGYIEKPINPDTFVDQIKQYINLTMPESREKP